MMRRGSVGESYDWQIHQRGTIRKRGEKWLHRHVLMLVHWLAVSNTNEACTSEMNSGKWRRKCTYIKQKLEGGKCCYPLTGMGSWDFRWIAKKNCSRNRLLAWCLTIRQILVLFSFFFGPRYQVRVWIHRMKSYLPFTMMFYWREWEMDESLYSGIYWRPGHICSSLTIACMAS